MNFFKRMLPVLVMMAGSLSMYGQENLLSNPGFELTDAEGLDDGPEYSPDGKYIWFNSVRTGLMQIWRMKNDGSEQTQMTFHQDLNSWFPHVSPDGKQVVYICYNKGDVDPGAHPANKNVELRLIQSDGGESRLLTKLFGGQSTLNVNIVGSHDPEDSMYGAYLVSNEKFGDFELELDAKPDWPADAGIMFRANKIATLGLQVLVDHRPHGNIGCIYGNSLGDFITASFYINGDRLPGFKVENLREDETIGTATRVKPDYAISFDEFKEIWRVNEWNHFKIRCVGRIPLGGRCKMPMEKYLYNAFEWRGYVNK